VIRPLREFITVKPAPAALSAIIDTSALKDDMMVGEVLAVGTGMRLKGNKVRPMCVKPGERVRFRLRSAKAWHDPMLKDVMLIQEDDVLGIEPKDEPAPSRSMQRRIASMKGEPAPEFA